MLGDKASNSVRITEQIRRELYNIFRLHNASASVYDNIKKNNLSLFVQKNIVSSIVSSKSKQQGHLNSFFENHLYPISISKNGQLEQCKTKLDLLAGFYAVVEPSIEPLDDDVKLVDGAVFVNMNLPRCSKIYGEYCDAEFTERISNIAQNIDRLDLVFDIYRTKSTKYQNKSTSGKSIRVSVRKKTPIYK